MKSDESNVVGQAVFGYSNGHRLLASTSSLSSVDVYELAAASDLAPGAQISRSASYLTGFSLPDSKMYALIRTWLAPEMPRPGCVWSHVLLLDHAFMATQVDLTVLGRMHRRPDRYASDESFSVPITVNRRQRGNVADRAATEKVLLACYADGALDEMVDTGQVLDNAILAVWSQQWPRLRRHFAFRSIASSSELNGQFLNFKRGSLSGLSPLPWLGEAVSDATSQTVTSLRRFLWRYGKDVHSERNVLPDLVTLYLATRSEKLSYLAASATLNRYRPGQAETLKKDILGLSEKKLSLIPSIDVVELMLLLASHKDLGLGLESGDITSIFSRVQSDQIVDVGNALVSSRETLGGLFDVILNAILPAVTATVLKDARTTDEFGRLVIFERPELLTKTVIKRFSEDDLLGFWGLGLTADQRRNVIRAMMQHEFADTFGDHAIEHSTETLEDALVSYGRSELDDSWLRFFRDNVQSFGDALRGISSGDKLMSAVQLFNFPMEPECNVRAWFDAFRSNRISLTHDSETLFLVYLLDLSIKNDLQKHRDVLIAILDPLRNRILLSDLPPGAEDMLSKCLPSDDARWDLNKRVLKLFRKSYKRGQELDDVLDSLHLSDDEYAYATDQDPENMVRRFWRVFYPWTTYWD
ncbi:GAP1-N1 domain-containing protein [Rhizobium ruizarguesonis]|uniref:GAP1-N1 domain-containing protein n=1 Tax=Rhizobium ruizarguesonis TaxID=2081791 RepID=UPI00102FDB45|nr:hypothetical protein [Rhizobium ruizarguesonis]TBB71758.1 hypothetical protein ELH45_14925 [Rhizobium ruizarguesonis]